MDVGSLWCDPLSGASLVPLSILDEGQSCETAGPHTPGKLVLNTNYSRLHCLVYISSEIIQ